MTTPRIEEMVNGYTKEAMLFKVGEGEMERHQRLQNYVVEALTQVHQAGIDEAVEVMRKKVEYNIQYLRKPVKGEDRFQMNRRRANNNYINGQQQALDDTIKALQNKK